MFPSHGVAVFLTVRGIVTMIVHVLVVVHVLVLVDVLPRLLVRVAVLVVVALLVRVRVVVLVLVHTSHSLALPLLQQAGRGKRGENKKEKMDRKPPSSHDFQSQLRRLVSARCRLVFPIFATLTCSGGSTWCDGL